MRFDKSSREEGPVLQERTTWTFGQSDQTTTPAPEPQQTQTSGLMWSWNRGDIDDFIFSMEDEQWECSSR